MRNGRGDNERGAAHERERGWDGYVCVYMYVCMHVRTCINTYVHTYLYSVCVCVCVCVHGPRAGESRLLLPVIFSEVSDFSDFSNFYM